MLVGRLIYNAITYFTRRFCTSGKHFKVQYIRLFSSIHYDCKLLLTRKGHKILYIYMYIYKNHLKRLDPQCILFQKNMNEMKDELDFLVAHRKQTRSSGNQILFQAWHIKGKRGSKGFENVILSHREIWHKPSNLQTNKTEKLEIKLAVNVFPPYIQTSDNTVELSLIFPPYHMLISFKEMWTQYISIAIKHLTVTEKSNTSYYPYRERTLLLRSL